MNWRNELAEFAKVLCAVVVMALGVIAASFWIQALDALIKHR